MRLRRHSSTSSSPRDESVRLADKGLLDPPSLPWAQIDVYGIWRPIFVRMADLNSSIERAVPALAASLFLPSWDTLLSGSPSLVLTTSRPLACSRSTPQSPCQM